MVLLISFFIRTALFASLLDTSQDPVEAVGRGGGKQGGDASSVQKTKTKTGAIPKEHPHVEARSPGTVEEDVVPESLSPR